MVAALDHVDGLPSHVVAQVVKTKLVVGSVGDVGGVLLAAHNGCLTGDDASGGHSQRTEHAAHEFRLVVGQIVVDRDDVHTAAGDGVEVGSSGCDQRLALTGLHFGNVAEVKRGTTHQLHVEVAKAEGTAARLTHGGKCLRQQVVERLPVGIALTQFDGLVFKFLVTEAGEVVFQSVDGLGIRLEATHDAPLSDAKDFFQD